MLTITQDSVLAKLPVTELQASLRAFLAPLTDRLPDARLPAVAELMVHGIIASQSPLITQIARGGRQHLRHLPLSCELHQAQCAKPLLPYPKQVVV
jgi:hypothetical protein